MKKENNKEQLERDLVQELKNQISESKNIEEIKKYYTKLVLAKERVKIQDQQHQIIRNQKELGSKKSSNNT